jgi:hypothetical protein
VADTIVTIDQSAGTTEPPLSASGLPPEEQPGRQPHRAASTAVEISALSALVISALPSESAFLVAPDEVCCDGETFEIVGVQG